MKTKSWLLTFVLLLALLVPGAASAQQGNPPPESILGLTVFPSPVVAGDTVHLVWDMDLNGGGTYRFRAYIPSDWYNGANWGTGTGVTVAGLGAITWADYGTACAGGSIGGVTMICNEWVGTDATGEMIESIDLSFTVSSSATAGSNRPVRVTNTAGSGGAPNISTVYVTVNPVPTTRYVGNTDCGGNTPCNTGVTALFDAVAALPAAGGTVYVYGVHDSDGALVGAKNIVLRPTDGASALRDAGTAVCTNGLVELDGAGNLTVDGLTFDGGGAGSCGDGIGVTGAGNLTVQNGASFTGWFDEGIVIFNGGSHTVSNSSFTNNLGGAADGIAIVGGTLVVEDTTFSNNGRRGVFTLGGTVTLRGNTFSNNAEYGYYYAGGALEAYANNLSGNNSGSFQAYVVDLDDAAKNWWGSHSDPNVGPTADGATSYAAGWNARLGADVASWAAGVGSVSLGSAALSGGGANTGVIINFDRGSANAPFDNGVPPYANRTCSDFYDFYALGGAGWTVQLPVDVTTLCTNNVRNYEIAFVINDNTNCATADDPACWDRIPDTQITVSGNDMLITGLSLAGTHIVAGDENGYDPTAISLKNVSALPVQNWLPAVLALALLALGSGGLLLIRKRS